MSDSAINVCDTCGKRKKVCCGYDESIDNFYGDGLKAPAECVDCCPQKEQHARDRELQERIGQHALWLPDGPCKRCVGKEVL